NKKRKQKITTILNTINNSLTVTKFSFEYVREKNEKWAYTVSFHFPEDTLLYFDEKFNAVFTKRYYDALLLLYVKVKFDISNPLEVVRMSKDITCSEEEHKEYTNWMYSDQNRAQKEEIYRETFYKVFGKLPDEMGEELFDIKD
ncbi:MAG: hypothetical protein LBI60_05670, partial [Bacteroidales bacterium]|nr:hypothetical protein [Bacteroidales bacterium]